jgi:hypothetical protein
MGLRNSDGAPVDPVPFLVVAATAFLVCFSFGPLYGTAIGASLPLALVGSGLVFVGITAGAYHRLVRQHNPEGPRAPPDVRLRNLFYVAAVLAGLLLLLALPLL